MICSAPFISAATRNRSPACRSGSSHSRPGGYDGARIVSRIAVRSIGSAAWKRGEPAAREQRPGHVERTPQGLAAPHRRDASPGGESVAPLRRGGHPRSDHDDVVGVLVRLVCVDRRGRRRRAPRGRSALGGRAATSTCRNVSVVVEREAALDRPDPLDAARDDCCIPADAGPQSLDVLEELRDRGVVAVADALDERPEAARCARRSAPRAPGTRSAGSGRRSRSASGAGGSPRRAAARLRPGRRPPRRRR